MKKFFVEGYGCAMNKAETQALKGFLQEQGMQESSLENCNLAVINTCAVKKPTEFKMLKRIRQLFELSKEKKFKLVVFGCLPKINGKEVEKISPSILQAGTSLKELAKKLGLQEKEFSPLSKQVSGNKLVSIINIAKGCLGNCSYCAVKNARGVLKSYSVKEISERFRQDLKNESIEFWLCAQDTACFGKDNKESLIELLNEMLKEKGEFRVRIGMMNPKFAKEIIPELLELMKNDERVFKFLHLPLQSGSDKILELMERGYKAKEWIKLVEKARNEIPSICVWTDIIAGFPEESEKDFQKTMQVLEKTKPDVVNISKFGKRPFTKAAGMKEINGAIVKERSKLLSELCWKNKLEKNKEMIGKIESVLITGKGIKGGFTGRTSNYKPIVIQEDFNGKIVKVKIENANETCLSGKAFASTRFEPKVQKRPFEQARIRKRWENTFQAKLQKN